MFSSSGLAEKRVEGIVSSADGLVAGHLAIRLNSMLQAVQLPTSISNLNSGLANVDRNTFTLRQEKAVRLKILQLVTILNLVPLSSSEASLAEARFIFPSGPIPQPTGKTKEATAEERDPVLSQIDRTNSGYLSFFCRVELKVIKLH